LKRIPQKLKLVGLDSIDYLADIIFMKQEAFSFKTAYFVKRNKKKIGHKLHHIWEELVKVGRGFRMLKEDLKFFLRL
jgi:hypothetical protein